MKCYACKALNASAEAVVHDNATTRFFAIALSRRARQARKERSLNRFCDLHMEGGLADTSMNKALIGRAQQIEAAQARKAERARREAAEKARKDEAAIAKQAS